PNNSNYPFGNSPWGYTAIDQGYNAIPTEASWLQQFGSLTSPDSARQPLPFTPAQWPGAQTAALDAQTAFETAGAVGANGLTPAQIVAQEFDALGPSSASFPDFAQVSLNPGSLTSTAGVPSPFTFLPTPDGFSAPNSPGFPGDNAIITGGTNIDSNAANTTIDPIAFNPNPLATIDPNAGATTIDPNAGANAIHPIAFNPNP